MFKFLILFSFLFSSSNLEVFISKLKTDNRYKGIGENESSSEKLIDLIDLVVKDSKDSDFSFIYQGDSLNTNSDDLKKLDSFLNDQSFNFSILHAANEKTIDTDLYPFFNKKYESIKMKLESPKNFTNEKLSFLLYMMVENIKKGVYSSESIKGFISAKNPMMKNETDQKIVEEFKQLVIKYAGFNNKDTFLTILNSLEMSKKDGLGNMRDSFDEVFK